MTTYHKQDYLLQSLQGNSALQFHKRARCHRGSFGTQCLWGLWYTSTVSSQPSCISFQKSNTFIVVGAYHPTADSKQSHSQFLIEILKPFFQLWPAEASQKANQFTGDWPRVSACNIIQLGEYFHVWNRKSVLDADMLAVAQSFRSAWDQGS